MRWPRARSRKGPCGQLQLYRVRRTDWGPTRELPGLGTPYTGSSGFRMKADHTMTRRPLFDRGSLEVAKARQFRDDILSLAPILNPLAVDLCSDLRAEGGGEVHLTRKRAAWLAGRRARMRRADQQETSQWRQL